MSRGALRRRGLVAAALVLAGCTSAPASTPPYDPVPSGPKSTPHLAAVRAAAGILTKVSMPTGAEGVARTPLRFLAHPSGIPLAQHARRIAFWTVPGTVSATVHYLEAHPPKGMHPSGSVKASGPGIPLNRSVDFRSGRFQMLDFTVAAYRQRVAVRADVAVLWAPRRNPADTIAATVRSVDIVVVRTNPQLHQGSPTVRRTLTGAAAQQLAAFVNRLPRAVPTAHVSCPAELGGERWFDRLRFHGLGPPALVIVDDKGCATTMLRVGERKPIELDNSRIEHMILSAVGLPDNYGR